MPIRRLLVALAALALVWAVTVWMTGGFFLQLGPLVLSSRRTTPAFLSALVCLGAATALTIARGRDRAREDWRWYSARVMAVGRASGSLARRWAKLAPLAILLFVVVQSAGRWATPRPLWLDEESTLVNIRDRGLTGLSGTLWFGQSAPLAWMAAERAMMVAAGDGDRALRLVPLVLGLGTCAIAYMTVRRRLDTLGCVVFVGCCGFGQWLVHNRFEAKPYSGDAFTTLLLIAVAAWAIDAGTSGDRYRRTRAWWIVAAATIWLANGAIMAAPGCALVLVMTIWKHDGIRGAARATAWAAVWIASFALCYWFSLRFTLGSTYLYDYWASVNAFPKDGATILERMQWLGRSFQSLAENPGGTTMWLVLWVSACAGLLLSRRRALAILAAAPPITALALGFVHLVPLHDRIALWILPCVYLGVALLADRAGAWLIAGVRGRAWLPLVASLVVLVPLGYLCNDIFELRDHDAPEMGGTQLNHGLDDQHAVAYLLAHRQPGDAVLTTHLGWPAVWWYGRISMADGTAAAAGHFADGGVQLEAGFDDSGDSCRSEISVADRISAEHRVLVYVGFPDQPGSFGSVLEAQLRHLGTIRELRSFGEGVVMVIDPHVPATLPPAPVGQQCIGASVAKRW